MKRASERLVYLDWVRGVAALLMLQGHVFNSFARNDLRPGGPYVISQFLGGLPPAAFLFLLGITFAFRIDSQERKGTPPAGRWRDSLKRTGYIFGAAFAFRLQLWLFSIDKSPWTDLLRVDILNSMGLALLFFSSMAFFRTRERIRLCAILGLAIAAASPLISGLDWSGAPQLLRHYIAPDHAFFSFFPWAAFVGFGMSAGSILRVLKPDEIPTCMQWFAWGGLSLAFTAWTLSSMPVSVYSKADFWLNSPALILIKTGAVLMLIAFAWIWTLQLPAGAWSWVRQFGLTSLLVYWVHIELVYGRWFGYLKENLTIGQTMLATVITVLLMLALSLVRTNWTAVKAYFAANRAVPDRIPGD